MNTYDIQNTLNYTQVKFSVCENNQNTNRRNCYLKCGLHNKILNLKN